MEKSLRLEAEVRRQTGSKAAARLRAQGKIPAVVYGHKEEPLTVSLDAHDFVEFLHHGQRLVDVQLDKKRQKVIVKDLQYDHLGKDVLHADFMRVDVTETITVTVPVKLKGTAKGTEHGGIIEQHSDRLEVECMVTEIPESIVVSVKDMDIGDTIHAGDVGLPERVKLVSNPEMLIVACSVVAEKTTEQVEEEAPSAPEVITEQKRAEREKEQKEEI